ncbi:MAG: FtsX-like permease family protein [Myxococcaceae bacterium]|nr:FtsX-like permease family protein [Myxococcaceae bacterium]
MTGFLSELALLFHIARRNLFTTFINFIIGLIILVGTCGQVAGSSLLSTLTSSMSKSVIGSAAGHLQVYNDASEDELAIYGQMGGQDPSLEPITDFPEVKKQLAADPNVKNIVPQGIGGGLITSGNTVDITLAKLRDLYRARDEKTPSTEGKRLTAEGYAEQIASVKEHIRQIVKVIHADAAKADALRDAKTVDPSEQEHLVTAASDAFWADFDKHPYDSLEFLENYIAPQAGDADMLYLRYLGTDLEAFQKAFDRMYLKEGQMVPTGKRGLLLPTYYYEENLKLKCARKLDKIKEQLANSRRTIATDEELKRWLKENQQQTREIVLQLDGIKTKTATTALQGFLKSDEKDLNGLLAKFFDMNDQNFHERYDFFYAQIVPLLELYRVRVGDTMTFKAYTKGGSVQAVNVRVYGTFEFKGLEQSPLAGAMALMDLMSFRDLYGYMSKDKLNEIQALKAAAPSKGLNRETAEDELFGQGGSVVNESVTSTIDEKQELSGTTAKKRGATLDENTYSQADFEAGVVLNVAVLLKNEHDLEATQARLSKMSTPNTHFRVVTWQKAAGVLGDFVYYARVGLSSAMSIIFVIAMIVISVAMIMATIARTATIGTMRAIGAQRTFIISMVLAETSALALFFGSLGAAIGSALILFIGNKGIPATTPEQYFFFAGPRFLPVLEPMHVISAFFIILAISALSTVLPAIIATRVSPLRAMQTDE